MTIKEIIATIIKKEGGYVNHPADKGGPTNYGITAKSYAEYFRRPAAASSKIPKKTIISEIKYVTPELAEKIYYTLYYVRPGIDLLPEQIQPIMLDMAVNHGRSGSVKILQTALAQAGINPGQPDGLIGKKTIMAAFKAVQLLGNHFINDLVNCRLNYYQEIINNDPTQAAFKAGWFARAESFRPEVAEA
jgi:lysozyme family protein